MRLLNVTGSHLTDRDRVHVRALLEHPTFKPGAAYRIGRSKTYTINFVDDALEVVIVEPEIDDWGRRFDRRLRSRFSVDVDLTNLDRSSKMES